MDKKITRHIYKIIAGSENSVNQDVVRTIFGLVDYTSLNTTDNSEKISTLVNTVSNFKTKYITNVAAICVFPVFITQVKQQLTDKNVNVVGVSASFPFSQTFDKVKYLETKMAIEAGADEIDIVMPIGLLGTVNENKITEEIKAIKSICGEKHLKVILESGILKDPGLIKYASELAIEGGADFIKTSTGKNDSTASYEAIYIMCKVIQLYYKTTGKKIGIKPAGGISVTQEAIKYYRIVKEILGEDWLNKDLFRIGASSLVKDILQHYTSILQ